MQIERISYLSNFEELVNEFGVGIQHVFADRPDSPGFSYTVGLFEAEHPEFIVFGFSMELAQSILNDLAGAVFNDYLRFAGNDRVHKLFQGAPAHLIQGADPDADYLGTAYSIRDRRHAARAESDIDVLQLIYQDPAERWPWEAGSDYVDWPRLGDWPLLAEMRNITMPSED